MPIWRLTFSLGCPLCGRVCVRRSLDTDDGASILPRPAYPASPPGSDRGYPRPAGLHVRSLQQGDESYCRSDAAARLYRLVAPVAVTSGWGEVTRDSGTQWARLVTDAGVPREHRICSDSSQAAHHHSGNHLWIVRAASHLDREYERIA